MKQFPPDFGLWLLNICSTVGVVLINKQLMSVDGYAYNYPTTLSGLHFFCTAFVAWIRSIKFENVVVAIEKEPLSIPNAHLFLYILVSVLALVAANISLLSNSVGLYQVCKLAQVPITCSTSSI